MRRHESTGKGQRLAACPSSCLQDRPGSARIRAFLFFLSRVLRCRAVVCSLTSCRRTIVGTGRSIFLPKRRDARDVRHRSTSAVSMHSVVANWCVRRGMCAALARPRAARHHVRRDARVWVQPKWIFLLPCSSRGQDAGSSIRRREFNSRTRCQHKKPSSSSRFGGGNRPQRWGGAGTRDRMEFLLLPRELSGQSAGLSSRMPRLARAARSAFGPLLRNVLRAALAEQLPHEAPVKFAEIAQQVERCVEGARVGGSIPSLGTRQTEPR